MSQMIPSTISPEVKSNAEKKIFQWFKDAPKTDDWIVLHSLGIANHEKNLIGEVDFCVLAPGLGIFALEVKGGRIRREDGKWHFTNRFGNTSTKTRGPFEQAKEGAFSIVNSIKKRKSPDYLHLNRMHFGYGVMFPDIQFDVPSVEYDLWQVFDKSYSNNVAQFIVNLSKEFKAKKIETYGKFDENSLPNKKDINHMKNILRSDFDKKVSLDVQIQDTEKKLIDLTHEQYDLLDQLEDNPRCLIHGPAGTGKTLVAVEEVKRHVREGKQVAFFCYNKNLAEWLKSSFNKNDIPGYIGTLHAFMLKCSKEADFLDKIPSTSSNDENFYRYALPKIAKEALKLLSVDFDVVIIDESQDLLNSENIAFIDDIISGGIFEGNWNFFGDFSRQSIYSESMSLDTVKKELSERAFFTNFKLKVNCRNTKYIHEEVVMISSFKDDTSVLKIEGIPVQHYTYNNRTEATHRLRKLLKSLYNEGINSNQITILSPFKFHHSIASQVDYPIKDAISDYQNSITFSTIHGFKGLENSIIIVTDIENINNKKLMYVALSRARSSLYIILSEEAQESYENIIKERVLNDNG